MSNDKKQKKKKPEKGKKQGKNKYAQFSKVALIFALFICLMQLSSAVVQTFQRDYFLNDSHTVRRHIAVFWYQGQYNGVLDQISDDSLLESYIMYSMYPNKWNSDNPTSLITNCTLTVNYFANKFNFTQVLFNETVLSTDPDIFGKKYFVRMPVKDGYTADIDCYYLNSAQTSIDIPVEMSMVAPSWECKACQMYQWTLLNRDVIKAQTLGGNTVAVWGYISQVIDLNLEIVLALFWLFLIFAFLGILGLVFYGILWSYSQLKELARRI